ncbi:acylphosphatase [bacterium SCSIO 12741]|nr:acylphosphatase [bacterium SCSIO 12741]
MNYRFQVQVYGKVQGVWYRKSTQVEALKLGLTGWVKNEPDGSVIMAFEGPFESCLALITWAHHGPEHARVDRIQLDQVEPKGGSGFEIVRY